MTNIINILENRKQKTLENTNEQAQNETNNQTFDYKIGIVGPTRVGKTSLITALLTEGQQLLTDTKVSMEALPKTKKRIVEHDAELRGSLMAGEFNPGGLSGSQEPFTFELAMTVGEGKWGKSQLRLAMLDYPGGWLDDDRRPAEREDDWQECKNWIKDSSVLFIPIDAAVAMECAIASENAGAIRTLQIKEAEFVAREWAEERVKRKESGLLLLVPIKCESYFNDNGGSKDRSEELFECITKFYQPLIKTVDGVRSAVPEEQRGNTNISIQYHPVDTIGCVEIKSAKWLTDSEDDSLRFECDYLVRDPGEVQPMGASGILISMCGHISSQQKNTRKLFNRFWNKVTGKEKELASAIEKLKEKPVGDRVRVDL